MFRIRHLAAASLAAVPSVLLAQQEPPSLPLPDDTSTIKRLGVVVVRGGRVGSLPSQIPTTFESIDAKKIESAINATDSEDALKYMPSLLVRKRYVGDYNHAVLSTRASGTGNSARSMVYADGILLSNLLGNGATFAPRWGLVTPEEIERVDVLYGPFAAAYPGNSVGAVVDYVTRMPTRFEGHAKASTFVQPFELYNTKATYTGWQSSASLGSREGEWSWWFNASRLDSEGQPLTFATRTVANGTAGAGGAAVSGAVPGLDRAGQPWSILGTGTQYRTVQDHLKLKVAYDPSPELRASYTLGWWRNQARGSSESYLRDASGDAVYGGGINIGGLEYLSASGGKAGVLASDFPLTRDQIEHVMQAVSLKSRTNGAFDWELAASAYDYNLDRQRRSGTALPGATMGGIGTLTDSRGTGWNTLALRGIWRPDGATGAHVVDTGVQQDTFMLRTRVSNVPDWHSGDNASLASRFDGNTQLRSAHAQDVWRFLPDWIAVFGLRVEHWRAFDGFTQNGANTFAHSSRSANAWSPKLALSRQMNDEWVLKASVGRAVRFPTVSELFQGSATSTGISNIANPDLRPEKSWTTELSSEWDFGHATTLRATLFHETTRDALYSQTLPGVVPITNSVQNVDRVRTLGAEVSAQGEDVLLRGLDLQASFTYADSKILANGSYVSTPGDTIGKWQPRVPRWRASALASWRADERWTVSYGARYSGVQYSSLDNSDVNGFAYQGASKYFTTDLRLRYAFDKGVAAAFGIDNLNNYKYWNFHPYPQRTYSAELKIDF